MDLAILDKSPKPFLKWAGGKTQLLDTFEEYYPAALKEGKIKNYVEPFIGSGALLFDLMSKYEFEKIKIFDINPELILVYNVIKYNVVKLIELLKNMELKYISLEGESRKNYYYEIRDLFNSNIYISNLEKYDPQMIDRAGQFIFLNRTCFNGLFRVNRSGQFNVPMGNYSNPMICNAENLTLVSHILQKVDIYLGDYRQSMEYIDENTFVYFDPPYRPLNQSSSFTSYSKDSFNDTNQRELAEYITLLKERNAYIMLSNSDPKNTDITDIFFDELYSNFKIHRIYARRMINSKADKRGLITELLITNY